MNSSNGFGFLPLLGIVFVTLKLTGYIDWSWWWVTLPFWGGLAVGAVFGVLWLFATAAEKLMER